METKTTYNQEDRMYYRKPATPEQQAARQEKFNRMRELGRKIKAMAPDERAEIAAKLGAITIEGRPLSIYNSCFIWSQMETASVVGGYAQWKRSGRQVMKGEHGLSIWIPKANPKTESEAQQAEADAEDRPAFFLGTVFDITQTQELTIQQSELAPATDQAQTELALAA